MGQHEGKVAMVTGGASGIGEGTVRAFADEGARVIIADVHEGRGHALAEELGSSAAVFVKTDVTREEDVQSAVQTAVQRFGRLDTIFNNAGYGGVAGAIERTDTGDAYRSTVDVLFTGVLLGMKHAAPIMKQQRSGSIVSTASIAGMRTGAGPHVYSALKAAVIQLTRSVAAELAPFGVRVNCVCPGVITTRIFGAGRGMPDETTDASLERLPELFADAQPLGRTGTPRDIAEGVLWLSSDAASFVTGHALVIDGGVTLEGNIFGDDPSETSNRFARAFGLDPATEAAARTARGGRD